MILLKYSNEIKDKIIRVTNTLFALFTCMMVQLIDREPYFVRILEHN